MDDARREGGASTKSAAPGRREFAELGTAEVGNISKSGFGDGILLVVILGAKDAGIGLGVGDGALSDVRGTMF